ncbi:hypothetical protein HDU86_002683 [Geranomyces michiganensis]|nr:hypothetical protein HDU86_002683 [Geranomyces michiganensis]
MVGLLKHMSDEQVPPFIHDAPACITPSVAARSTNSPEHTPGVVEDRPVPSAGNSAPEELVASSKEPSAPVKAPAKKPRHPSAAKGASRSAADPSTAPPGTASSRPGKGKAPAVPVAPPSSPAPGAAPVAIVLDDDASDTPIPSSDLDYPALPPLPAFGIPAQAAPLRPNAPSHGYLPALAAAADHLPLGHQAGVAHQAQVAAYALGAVPIDLDQPLVALSLPDANVADSLARRAKFTAAGNLARTRERLRNAGAEFDQTVLDLFIRMRYVDLGKIHPDRMYVTSGSTVTYVPKGDNLVPVKTDSALVPIDFLGPWLSAWQVYAWVNALLFPARFYELEGYKNHIQSLDGRYYWHDIYAYDQARRGYVSANPQVSLSVYMPDIKERCLPMPIVVTTRGRGGRAQQGQSRHNPVATHAAGSTDRQSAQFCYAFNGRNGCKSSAANCRFRHECLACRGGSHSRSNPSCPSRGQNRQTINTEVSAHQ